MLSREYLKEICPIHIKDLCKITGETQSEICKGWLLNYLRRDDFSFVYGTLYYDGN